MLVWYRQQVKDHGLPKATRLLGRVALSRSRVKLAIKELHRVLRPGSGELVVSVPMTAPGTITEEYGFADLTQSGHWRIYGDDFVTRLIESWLRCNSSSLICALKIIDNTPSSRSDSTCVGNIQPEPGDLPHNYTQLAYKVKNMSSM